MHVRRYRHLPTWMLIAAIGVASPILILAAIVMDCLNGLRMRKAAKIFRCEKCGQVLGLDGLALGEEVWSAELRDIISNSPPDERLRVVRSVHAVCPKCGERYFWRERDQSFRVDRLSEEKVNR